MQKRMHLKYRRHKVKSTFILMILILVVIAVFILFYQINKKITPALMSYAEIEAYKLSSLIISQAITSQFEDENTIEKLFTVEKNSRNEIQTIDFKTNVVNKCLTDLTTNIQKNYKYIEKGEVDKIDESILSSYDTERLKKGIIYEMPLGLATQNSLFANLGPKVPVRLTLAGTIISNINTKITNYGINNVLLEVIVHLEATNQIFMPLLSKKIVVKMDVPIAIKLIQGNIPSSYIGSLSKSSGETMIPME